MAHKKPQPIKALEGRYLATSRGYSYIIEVTDQDYRGVALYRLQSLMHDWRTPSGMKRLPASEKLWTAEELRDAGRILKNAPTAAAIEKAKKVPEPWLKLR